jgi:hypothetical protein
MARSPAVTVLVAIAMIAAAGICLLDFFDAHAAGAHPPMALAAALLFPLFLAPGHCLAAALVPGALGALLDPSTPPPRP